MICYYHYEQSYSGGRLLVRRSYWFYIMNLVPEKHIDLACFICYKFMSTLSFKIMKENTQISRISTAVLRDLLNFGVQLFLKKNKNCLTVFEKVLTYYSNA